MGRALRGLFVASLLLVGLSCSSDAGVDDGTPEYTLSEIHGDPSTKVEFAEILDVVQKGGGICAPEPDREHVADVIAGSWEASGEKETLLAYAQAFVILCS